MVGCQSVHTTRQGGVRDDFRASAQDAPVGLLVDGVSQPRAIDRETPRFSWQSADTRRGAMQTAYQVLVSSSPQCLAANKGKWWDSGKINSDQSASVEYAGKPLAGASRFWWKVRVWDQAGRVSDYSAPESFDTGLAQNEWSARFIWDGTTNVNNFAYFRKTFSITRQPSFAKVYVSAHDNYLLFLNGQFVGRGPARCDPYYFGQYNAYDITRLLKPGLNVFAALGHWQGTFINSGVNAQPYFLMEARLAYPDGSSATIGTDGSWKVLAQTPFIETDPTYFSDHLQKRLATSRDFATAADLDDPQLSADTVVIRSGVQTRFIPNAGAPGSRNRCAIQFDSRREPAGWKMPGFDDSKWASATVLGQTDYHLFAQTAPAENEQAELKPISVTQTDGAWMVDFGRCIDGWPELTMRANKPGDAVRVEYFQMTGERKSAGWDQYVCSGGTEVWNPDFGRHTSFQVIKITGYAGELEPADVRGIWAYCDADVAGLSTAPAICSTRSTKCASVPRGKTSSKGSSAWTPTASNLNGPATVGTLEMSCSTTIATR